MDSDVVLHRSGRGAPVVLLHALGCDSRSWQPIIPALAENFTVIAVDLPGFGLSPPLATQTEPTPTALAEAVAAALDEAGIDNPHVVGNSIGGWIALELARIRPVASLTLLGPAGMWPGKTPWYCRVSLRVTRWLTQHLTSTLKAVSKYRLGRVLLLGQTHGHPTQASAQYAADAIDAMGTCPGFAATLRATRHRRYQSSAELRERLPPATVAFGTRDLLLICRSWRRTDELPTRTTERKLPGCGHLPMSDDPVRVVDLIAASVSSNS
jgi:pimeloyl-ACP methyl ester carboxylesterase